MITPDMGLRTPPLAYQRALVRIDTTDPEEGEFTTPDHWFEYKFAYFVGNHEMSHACCGDTQAIAQVLSLMQKRVRSSEARAVDCSRS